MLFFQRARSFGVFYWVFVLLVWRMFPLAYWVHDLNPFVIQFTETFGVRYYGLAYLAGFGFAWWMLRRYARSGLTLLSVEQIGDLMTALVLGVMIGGRLGYFVFYHPGLLAEDPLGLVRIWEGGMASHGGFIGVAIALVWCARRWGVSWLHVGDLVASVAPLGLLFGRVANFINGELWGRVTDVPWAVIFPASAAPGTPVEWIPPRHPSQLYAAVLEGGLLLVLMQGLMWRAPGLRATPGRLAGVFLASYAIARSIGEMYREPDASLIFGLTRGTFYSLFCAAAGVALVFSARRVGPGAATRDLEGK